MSAAGTRLHSAQWRKTRIKVRIGREDESRWLELDAWLPPQYCGLAITDAQALIGPSWAITHVPSGRRIAPADTFDDARAKIAAIASLADWTRSARQLARQTRTLRRVRDVLAELDWPGPHARSRP